MCDGRSCLSDFKFHIIWNLLIAWAISSAGRALRSQRRGREFEPLIVHQYSPAVVMIAGLFYFLASKSSSIASFRSALKGFIVIPIVNRVCSIDSEISGSFYCIKHRRASAKKDCSVIHLTVLV